MKFSKHAAQRLTNRNIELTSGQIERLQEGTARAQEKGIKESLVLVDQLAFIVNIPQWTGRMRQKTYLQILTEQSLYSRTFVLEAIGS